MKKAVFTLVIILAVQCSYAQIEFEQGYFVDNDGNRVNCLIKNYGWKNNPREFEYKLLDTSSVQKATIDSVQEFALADKVRYVRTTVEIDRSTNVAAELDENKKPVFHKDQLFLQVLLAGDASLYYYEDDKVRRYFFQVNQSDIQQLVYKKYLNPQRKIATNRAYRQQLWNSLKCDNIAVQDVEAVNYSHKDLMDYFIRYNNCQGAAYQLYIPEGNTNLFHLTIRPGMFFSSLSMMNPERNFDLDFGSQIVFRLGAELEVVLPFNRNKWAFFTEPTYQSYKNEGIHNSRNVVVKYSSIEFPFGVRHYFFLSDKSKLFLNAAVLYDLPLNSQIEVENLMPMKIRSGFNAAAGVGYNYASKLSLELRYAFSRELLINHLFGDTDYNGLSVIFGYRIL